MSAARTPAGEKGTADRIEADDGAYWVRLVTRQALDREGEAMDHCVGDGNFDSLVGGEDLTDGSIWSLRRANGVSVLTVRIEDTFGPANLNYARGYDNHAPGRGAALQVRHLVKAFEAAGTKLHVCPSSRIVVVPDGRTFRDDRIPPAVQAALDEEQRQFRERQAAVDAQRPRVRLGRAMYSLMTVQESAAVAVVAALDTQVDIPVFLHSPEMFSDAYLRHVFGDPPQPRPRSHIGVWTAPQVERGYIYDVAPLGLTLADETQDLWSGINIVDGSRDMPLVVAAATAGGVDLVEGTDYRVADSAMGLVKFLRSHRDVEVLWEMKAEPMTPDPSRGLFTFGRSVARAHSALRD